MCCQWSKETENLLSTHEFAQMKRGAVLVNVARGEIVDTDALVESHPLTLSHPVFRVF